MRSKKVIIDCDPGIDDSLALIYALNNPNFEVIAISLVAGNVAPEKGKDNVFRVLELLDRTDIPVWYGAEKPLKVEYTSAEDTHGQDGLGETFIPVNNEHKLVPWDKYKTLFTTFLDYGENVSFITLGPLTNMAHFFGQFPGFMSSVVDFTMMGGNYKSHGNCSQLAEYNFWCDPDAAEYMFPVFSHSNKKATVVPLDATRKIVLTDKIIDLIKHFNPKIGDFIYKITRFYMDFHKKYERIDGCVINDPLAISIAIHPEFVIKTINAYVDVVTEGKARGVMLVDKMNFYHKRRNARLVLDIDVEKFFTDYIATICQVSEEEVIKEAKARKINFNYKYPYEI